MARHILAACVVCLLCADNIPCQQHFGPAALNDFAASPINNNLNGRYLHTQDDIKTTPHPTHRINKYNRNHIGNGNSNEKDYHLTIKDLENHPRLQANGINESPATGSDNDLFDSRNPYRNQIPNNVLPKLTKSELRNLKRQSRHAGHDHGHDDDANSNISPITAEYIKKIFLNYGEKGREMNLEDFQTMMKKLNLNKLKYNNGTTIATTTEDNGECASINQLFEHLYPEVKENLQKEYEELVRENPILAKNYEVAEPSYKLTKNNINSMCPILLYQLLSDNSNENEGCIQLKNLKVTQSKHLHDHDHDAATETYEKDTLLIWLYSSLSVIFCGLLGLVGVAVIPFMNTVFYQQIISFLVALAVGTMTGDALLHLIPHSVNCATEKEMVKKGLVCVLGIIGFYAIENGFTLISEYRRRNRRKNKANSNSNVKVMRTKNADTNANKDDADAGDRLCKSKYSTDYCYEEVAMENNDENHANQHPENHALSDGLNHENSVIHDNESPLPVSVILREHDHTHHGHAHKHGHVHSPPSTISAVAWMIILGDGLHNFTDGMAIGAAFSESIPGGFSTSLAVFCHELPHELGDFAILIKAGMTPKAAVAYNCLTAILSFFGMIFGIVFGENDEASRWMFAVAAGLFIYIALVDMMPEMTSAHNSIQQILLQLLGLVGGLMSMLLIALYEHELMNIFGGHNHSHACPGELASSAHGHSHGGHGHSH